jgi:hypothetical protein
MPAADRQDEPVQRATWSGQPAAAPFIDQVATRRTAQRATQAFAGPAATQRPAPAIGSQATAQRATAHAPTPLPATPLILRTARDAGSTAATPADAAIAQRTAAFQPEDRPALQTVRSGHAEPVVARETAAPMAAAQSVPLQREAESAPTAAAPGPGEAPGGSATSSSAGAAPAGIPTGDKELDDLAHRLYDRIRSRLRLELLIDRERTGTLSDFG